MRLSIIALVIVGGLALPADAQAWTWGRFYPTSSSAEAAAPLAVAPMVAPAPPCSYGPTPNVQSYAAPAYNLYYPGYYQVYDRGAGNLYGGPYRASYYPGSGLYSGRAGGYRGY